MEGRKFFDKVPLTVNRDSNLFNCLLMPSVVVVIPVYKAALSNDERASLSRCFSVLHRYPIVFISPEGLDWEPITELFTPDRVEYFSADYFSSKVAYNALMLSPMFYKRFLAWDYMLLYQLDAWVFSGRAGRLGCERV